MKPTVYQYNLSSIYKFMTYIYLTDFISVELVDGFPRLLIDFGSGTLELIVVTEIRLNDSSWHRLDVLWNTEVGVNKQTTLE